MQHTMVMAGWRRVNAWRKKRRVQNAFALSLALLAPVLVFLTYYVVQDNEASFSNRAIRLVLLCDFVYVLSVAALVLRRILQMLSARNAKTAGSRLHLRLSGVFAFVALVPTVLVAVIAAILLNFGFENWFSVRVRNVVGSSLAAAQASPAPLGQAATAQRGSPRFRGSSGSRCSTASRPTPC